VTAIKTTVSPKVLAGFEASLETADPGDDVDLPAAVLRADLGLDLIEQGPESTTSRCLRGRDRWTGSFLGRCMPEW